MWQILSAAPFSEHSDSDAFFFLRTLCQNHDRKATPHNITYHETRDWQTLGFSSGSMARKLFESQSRWTSAWDIDIFIFIYIYIYIYLYLYIFIYNYIDTTSLCVKET